MARRAALAKEVRQRLNQHSRQALTQVPLAGVVSGESDGIRLLRDGSVEATLRFQDIHGVRTTVILQAEPGAGIEEIRPRKAEPETVSPVGVGDESEDRLRVVTDLAREYLPAGAAEDFLATLRPALRLVHASETDPVVAQLGGLPTLPINSWPVWDGHGPLGHVLSFDCAPVAAMLPELGIPKDGRLAFFYFDPRYDGFESYVGHLNPSSHAGFRVMRLHPELSTRTHITDAATPAPPGLAPFPTVALTAVRTVTWPSPDTPIAEAVWRKHGLERSAQTYEMAAPVAALSDALWELPDFHNTHQIGGHPHPQQESVEDEVEAFRRGILGEQVDWTAPEFQAAASDWQLVLQVASDDAADMMWGDVGQLYYLARNTERPEEAVFTSQS